jgi:hypothetical protein
MTSLRAAGSTQGKSYARRPRGLNGTEFSHFSNIIRMHWIGGVGPGI